MSDPKDDNRRLREELDAMRARLAALQRSDADRRAAEATLESRALRWTAVSAIGQSAISGKPLPALMDEVVSRVARALEVELAAVLELMPDGQGLIVRSGVGWQEGVVGKTLVPAKAGSLAGYTILTAAPVIVKDFRSEDRFPLSPVLHEHKVMSGFTVLLRGRDRPYGVLSAFSRSPRNFSAEDVDFLGVVGNLLAAAIERMRGEDALRESERRFRELVENVQLAAVMLNPRGQIIFCNDYLLSLTGWRREEVVGQGWFRLFLPPGVRDTVQQLFERTIMTGTFPARSENEIQTRQGERHLIAWSNTVLRDPQGKPNGTMSFGEVITSRRRAEEALRQSEAHLRNILDSLPVFVGVLSPEGRIIWGNRSALTRFHLSLEETVGKLFPEIPPFSQSAPEQARIKDAIVRAARGETVRYDARLLAPDGQTVVVDIVLTPVFDSEGRVSHLIPSGIDISARKEAETALADEKELLAATVRSIGDAVVRIDATGRIVLFNSVAETFTGVREKEAVGRPLSEIVTLLDAQTRERHQDPAEQAMKRRTGAVQPGNMICVSRDGTERIVSDTTTPIFGPDGRAMGGVLVWRDITERRRTEEEMHKVTRLESIGVLAGGIAHDFNNILTAVLGNILLVKMRLGAEEPALQRLAEAETACLRAKDLTKQLLTFSKGGDPVKTVASMAGLARQAAGFALRGANVRCDFQLPDDLWHAEIDEGQMRQVLSDIVLNALQAMPEGGTIRIKGANVTLGPEQVGGAAPLPPGRYVRISVEDEGIGIPQENLARVFDPYFTTKPKGSGLGLSIAYSVVTKHDGRIEVQSKPGKGSVFQILLPAAVRLPSPEAGPIAGADLPPTRGRILIMDDEEMIKVVTGGMLRHFGYDTDFAGDGTEAIALYEKAREAGRPYDAVILDLTIPGGMGGEETIRRLKGIDPEVRAIVASGYSNSPIMSDFRSYGFSGVVAKPFGLKDLKEALSSVLETAPGRPRG